MEYVTIQGWHILVGKLLGDNCFAGGLLLHDPVVHMKPFPVYSSPASVNAILIEYGFQFSLIARDDGLVAIFAFSLQLP